MLVNLKILTLIIVGGLLVEFCSAGCKTKKKKCKKNSKNGIASSPPQPVSKNLKWWEKNNGMDKLMVVENGTLWNSNGTVPGEMELPKEFRSASYVKVLLPPQGKIEDMAEVIIDGVKWLIPKNDTHQVRNSTNFKPLGEKETPAAKDVLPEKLKARIVGSVRIVTEDFFCLETYSSDVRETVCRDHSDQKFSLISTAFSHTFLISDNNGRCIVEGGSTAPCNLRDQSQKFIKQDRKIFKLGDKGMLCPFSNGVGQKGFLMSSCPAAPTYSYGVKDYSPSFPQAVYSRFINDEGFCLQIYGDWVGSVLCNAQEQQQKMRKIQRPGGLFWIQSAWGSCVFEYNYGGDKVLIYFVTNDCSKSARGFIYDPLLKKGNCITTYCVKNDCNPRWKWTVPRKCAEGRRDQRWDIVPYDNSFVGHRKTWVVFRYAQQVGENYCVSHGSVLHSCDSQRFDDPPAWFSESEYTTTSTDKNLTQITYTTSIPGTLDYLTNRISIHSAPKHPDIEWRGSFRCVSEFCVAIMFVHEPPIDVTEVVYKTA